ncbi:poly(3-hydroxyalkanoate) depolymerase [Salinisphaera sp. C84B14]|uniref:alpha/beta fold hydrolase n=1 Tax=Salinisphaera sp. C84B14 TaxID=1304155 RepID=UPI003342B5EC
MSARSEPAHIEHVALDGERLHTAFVSGRGVPLLLCNDFVANLDILDEFATALGRPVLRFDLPGVGTSAEVVRMRRMPALATLLAKLLDHYGLSEPVDVMGIGWGGLLAQQFAQSQGDRVRRLVLAATASGQLMFPGRLASLVRLARPDALGRVAPDGEQARIVFGGRRNDECRQIATAFRRATAPTRRGYAAQIYALTGFSSLTWLHRLNIPTLVLAGDDDSIVPTVNARVLSLLLPQARLEIIRGGGHWFVLERTDDVVRMLDEFLEAKVAISAADQNSTF